MVSNCLSLLHEPLSEPTVAPVISSTVIITPHELTFTWEPIPCGSRGGSNLRYSYNLKLDGVFQYGWRSLDGNSASFINLVECTRYEFVVRGVNDVGDGPAMSKGVSTRSLSELISFFFLFF